MKDVRTTGIDDYMSGLIAFAQGVVPGSARVFASTGDERNALLMVTVEADLGGGKMELPGARLYLLARRRPRRTRTRDRRLGNFRPGDHLVMLLMMRGVGRRPPRRRCG
jgi:hypothetical protein